MLDVKRIRPDFPILERKENGARLVYLDNAATSQKPRTVLEAIQHYYSFHNANVHRGAYALAVEATDAYEAARTAVARLVTACARVRARWSPAPSPVPICAWTCRPSTATSTRYRATRCSGRWAAALSWPSPSCSKRCRPIMAAVR